MSKNTKSQLNNKTNATNSKPLFKPLSKKEQQITSGGWGWSRYW